MLNHFQTVGVVTTGKQDIDPLYTSVLVISRSMPVPRYRSCLITAEVLALSILKSSLLEAGTKAFVLDRRHQSWAIVLTGVSSHSQPSTAARKIGQDVCANIDFS